MYRMVARRDGEILKVWFAFDDSGASHPPLPLGAIIQYEPLNDEAPASAPVADTDYIEYTEVYEDEWPIAIVELATDPAP